MLRNSRGRNVESKEGGKTNATGEERDNDDIKWMEELKEGTTTTNGTGKGEKKWYNFKVDSTDDVKFVLNFETNKKKKQKDVRSNKQLALSRLKDTNGRLP